jgi:tetratricopeptide (TPR) repeat protein
LARGSRLSAGIEIEVPARTVIVLRSDLGNETTLSPNARFRVESTTADGESYSLLAGRLTMRVVKALNFFNVDFGTFVARVRGTEFEIVLLDARSAKASVQHGTVSVTREIPTQLGDGKPFLPMLANERLQADERAFAIWSGSEAARRYASPEAAAEVYRTNLKAAEEQHDFDATEAALNNLGLTEMAAGRPAQARDLFKQLLDHATMRGDTPWRARALNNMAAADIKLGDWSQARMFLEAALTANQELAPVGNARRIAENEGNLGVVLRRLGELDKARAAIQRSIASYRSVDGPGDSAGIADDLDTLGLIERADPDKAVVALSQALEMRKRLHGEANHPETAGSLGNLGSVLCTQGRIKDGLGYLDAALKMRLALRARHPDLDLARAYESLAECWAHGAAAGWPEAAYRASGYMAEAKAERSP